MEQMDRLHQLADYFLPSTRLVLALVAVMFTLMLILHGSPLALLPLLCGVLLVWDYFRNSGVWIAFRAFRQGDLLRARRCLRSVHLPVLLSPQSRAYYHWLKGVGEATDGRYEAARVYLLIATTGELRTENDRSLVHCLLAEVALQTGAAEAARDHLRLANALSHHADVGRIIQRLKARLSAAGGG